MIKKIFIFMIIASMFTFNVYAQDDVSGYIHIDVKSGGLQRYIFGVNQFNLEALPGSYQSPYITSIKNQGSDNTCWAFAAIGVLESYVLKYFSEAVDFSENHLQYMLSNENNNSLGYIVGTGPQSGGNGYFASSYFMNDYGPVLESDDLYINTVGRDFSATKDIPKSEYKVTSVTFVDQIEEAGLSENKIAGIEATKRLIYDYGATTGAMYSDDSYFTSDNENYYCGVKNGINHQIMLVGWDDNYPKEKFTRENDANSTPAYDGAFIVKNSWGADNHGDGLFYISYCDYNALSGVFAITGVEKRNEKELLYSYDAYFSAGGISASKNGDTLMNAYGNVFKKKTPSEKLTKAQVYCFAGYEYDVYLADCDSVWTENSMNFENNNFTHLGSLTPSYDGYYTIDTDIDIKNDEFSIIVIANNPLYEDEGGWLLTMMEMNGGNIGNATANIGESFYGNITNNNFETAYAQVLADDKVTVVDEFYFNVPVKAVTETNDSYGNFLFANFTNEDGTELESFQKGDSVYIVPAFDGVNTSGKQIICAGYKDNKLSVIDVKDVNMKGKNRFLFNNISSDMTFRFYLWDLDGITPLSKSINVGK